MGWVLIENEEGFGFNLMLVQTDNMYGDWYILNNKNNLSHMTQDKQKQEPFAFKIDELEQALRGIHATSLYSSDVELFDEQKIIALVSRLINQPK